LSSSSSDYTSERTIVLYNPEEIVNAVLENFLQLKTSMDYCIGEQGAAVTINAKPIWEGFIVLKNRGIRIRWITDITKENNNYCKEIMRVVEVRHLDGIKGAFGIHDGRHYFASANVTKEGRIYPGEMIVSNVKVIAEQQQQVFNLLRDKAIPANQRIKEIEQGLKREFIDTIRDPMDILNLIFKVLKSATDELQLLFSSFNAFQILRQIGILEIIRELASEHWVDVKILVNMENEDEIIKISKELTIGYNYDAAEQNNSIRFRPAMKSLFHTKITTFIVDSTFSLTVEIKDNDDANESFEESIGMATYSNSQSTVDSYATIFENLWTKAGFVT
jgi:two-component system sensor histidine kinase VicK